MLRSSKSPQEGALQVQSSEDFQDGREASLGFHTPQVYTHPILQALHLFFMIAVGVCSSRHRYAHTHV